MIAHSYSTSRPASSKVVVALLSGAPARIFSTHTKLTVFRSAIVRSFLRYQPVWA